jgi:hypothetical protein
MDLTNAHAGLGTPEAGKSKGGRECDGCSPKKDFVAFLFIHHNVLEAL